MRLTKRRVQYWPAGLRWPLAFALGVVLSVASPMHAQNRPPLTEPVALEGTMKSFYKGAKVVIVTTMDGVEHVYRFTKDLIVHGGRKPGVDALEGLREGTTVVIHEDAGGEQASAEEIDVLGDDGLKISEGIVTDIDRGKKEITIRYDNGQIETLQMTTRAAAESTPDLDEASNQPTRIVVYYSDEEGNKIAHYFRKVS